MTAGGDDAAMTTAPVPPHIARLILERAAHHEDLAAQWRGLLAMLETPSPDVAPDTHPLDAAPRRHIASGSDG